MGGGAGAIPNLSPLDCICAALLVYIPLHTVKKLCELTFHQCLTSYWKMHQIRWERGPCEKVVRVAQTPLGSCEKVYVSKSGEGNNHAAQWSQLHTSPGIVIVMHPSTPNTPGTMIMEAGGSRDSRACLVRDPSVGGVTATGRLCTQTNLRESH